MHEVSTEVDSPTTVADINVNIHKPDLEQPKVPSSPKKQAIPVTKSPSTAAKLNNHEESIQQEQQPGSSTATKLSLQSTMTMPETVTAESALNTDAPVDNSIKESKENLGEDLTSAEADNKKTVEEKLENR